MVSLTFPLKAEAAVLATDDGLDVLCTTNEDFDHAYLHLRTV